MQGKTRRGSAYYVCEPKKNWGQEAMRLFPGVYVGQESLLEGIFGFFSDRILGPRRRELLEADQRILDGEPERKREARVKALGRAAEKLETRQARLIVGLEREDDPEGLVFRRVRDRLVEVERERREVLDELRALEKEIGRRETGSAELLDALPVGPAELGSLPEEVMRGLFEAFRLQVRYDPDVNLARCRVTLSADSVDAMIADVAHLVGAPNWTVSEKPSPAPV